MTTTGEEEEELVDPSADTETAADEESPSFSTWSDAASATLR